MVCLTIQLCTKSKSYGVRFSQTLGGWECNVESRVKELWFNNNCDDKNAADLLVSTIFVKVSLYI